MTRGRARRYLLVKQGYYPQVVADAGYTVFDWSTLNAGTLFQDSAKTTPASANGDVIGCWTDGVGGVDATQATTAVKPTYDAASLNGLATIAFDGSDMLSTANITIGTFVVWIVFRNSAANAIVYEHSVTNASNDGHYLFAGTSGSLAVRRTTRIIKNGQALTDNTWRVVRNEHNGTYASLRYYANDAELTTTTSGTAVDIGTGTATQPFFIGARSGVAFPVTGNIGQLLIVSPYPTDASILVNMESYINNQWNGVY